MGLIAIQYHLVPDAPVLVAANREEYFDREWTSPSIQSGKPRILCGLDQRAGGTWLGVNQRGLFVGLTNRRRSMPPMAPKSRGLLCRQLLGAGSSQQAVSIAMDELSTGIYDGCNFVIADRDGGWTVHGGDDVNAVELQEGLNIIANNDLNDLHDERVALIHRLLTIQLLDSPVKFLALASKVFARAPSPPGRPSVILRDKEHGTICSTLLALGIKPRDAIYQFASDAPDKAKFEDYSPLLRDILSRGLREARQQAANAS